MSRLTFIRSFLSDKEVDVIVERSSPSAIADAVPFAWIASRGTPSLSRFAYVLEERLRLDILPLVNTLEGVKRSTTGLSTTRHATMIAMPTLVISTVSLDPKSCLIYRKLTPYSSKKRKRQWSKCSLPPNLLVNPSRFLRLQFLLWNIQGQKSESVPPSNAAPSADSIKWVQVR